MQGLLEPCYEIKLDKAEGVHFPLVFSVGRFSASRSFEIICSSGVCTEGFFIWFPPPRMTRSHTDTIRKPVAIMGSWTICKPRCIYRADCSQSPVLSAL